jgi:hypothetical protein
VPRSGPDRNSGVIKYVRRFLIALSFATLTFGLTTVTALADGVGGCCLR